MRKCYKLIILSTFISISSAFLELPGQQSVNDPAIYPVHSAKYPMQPAKYGVRPVKLGAVLPLTGDLAYYGNEIKNGLLLAQEHSKYPVEIVLEDAPVLGPNIVTAFEKLVRVGQIDGIAGNFSNQAMLIMSSGIERHRLPAFHTAAADEQILGASDWIFASNVRVTDEARAVAEYAFKILGVRRAAVIAIETSFGQGYRKAFNERFQALGGQIVADEMQQTTEIDFFSQAMRVRAAQPEVVFLAAFGPYLGGVARQLRQLGVTTPLLSVYEAEDPSVVAAAGKEALEGIRYFVSYSKDAKFEKIYRERFGAEPGTFSRNAYDAARLLTQVTLECRFDRSCMKERLYQVRGYRGASGNIDIEPDGGTSKRFVLHEFRNGAFGVAAGG